MPVVMFSMQIDDFSVPLVLPLACDGRLANMADSICQFSGETPATPPAYFVLHKGRGLSRKGTTIYGTPLVTEGGSKLRFRIHSFGKGSPVSGLCLI